MKFLWIIVTLCVVVAAVLTSPPRPSTGHLIVTVSPQLSFEILTPRYSAKPVCLTQLAKVADAVFHQCPACVIDRKICLAHLGNELVTLRQSDPIADFSLRTPTGSDIVFTARHPDIAQAACEASAQSLGIRCAGPNTPRPGSGIWPILEKPFTGSESANGQRVSQSLFQSLLWPVLLGFFLSFLFAWAIYLTRALHGRWSFDATKGIQKVHTDRVPRIGGLALILSLGIVSMSLTEAPLYGLWQMVFLGSVIVFAAGFAEDVTRRLGATERLMLTMLGTALVWWATGIGLNRLELGFIDHWLVTDWLALCVTMVAVAGIAHAVNLVDGVHGLALGAVMVALLAIAAIAAQNSDHSLLSLTAILLAVCAGLLVWNYPRGLIFLGDGGAYWLGFMLAWIAILLPVRNPDVSPWASLLACIYPITETLVSMARRVLQGQSMGAADSAHLHSLLLVKNSRQPQEDKPARLVDEGAAHESITNIKNARVAPTILPLVALPAACAAAGFAHTGVLQIATLLWVVGFLLIYQRLYRHGVGISTKSLGG